MAEALAKMEPLNIISAPAQTMALDELRQAAEGPEQAQAVFAAMCSAVGASSVAFCLGLGAWGSESACHVRWHGCVLC